MLSVRCLSCRRSYSIWNMIYEDPKKHKTSGKMFSRKLRIGEIFEKVLQSWSCTLQKERYNKSASVWGHRKREQYE